MCARDSRVGCRFSLRCCHVVRCCFVLCFLTAPGSPCDVLRLLKRCVSPGTGTYIPVKPRPLRPPGLFETRPELLRLRTVLSSLYGDELCVVFGPVCVCLCVFPMGSHVPHNERRFSGHLLPPTGGFDILFPFFFFIFFYFFSAAGTKLL